METTTPTQRASVWTPGVVEQLLELHAKGVSHRRMAPILGISKSSIADQLVKLGRHTFGASNSGSWTPEREARLRELWETGVPVNAIARAFGIDHKAVRSKVTRMGLPPRVAMRVVRTAYDPPPKVEVDPTTLIGRPTLLELPFHGACKYALGEREGTHVFCGEPTPHGSWCPEHRSRVFRGEAR